MDRTHWRGELGARIAERRKAKGLSLQACAADCGMAYPSLYRIEMGQKDLGIGTLARIATVLGTTPSTLLRGITAEQFSL